MASPPQKRSAVACSVSAGKVAFAPPPAAARTSTRGPAAAGFADVHATRTAPGAAAGVSRTARGEFTSEKATAFESASTRGARRPPSPSAKTHDARALKALKARVAGAAHAML